MIWGMSFDDSFEDEVKVTIIATWFNDQPPKWPIHKKVITNTRWDPIRKNWSEDFVTRVVSNGWFTTSQTWGFSSTNVENNTTELTNNAFRAPDNSEEDWETPAFMTKKLNNWEENN
jgi:hypothetical protein